MANKMQQAVIDIKLEVYTSLNEIIRLQADSIKELILLLYQHTDIEESDLASVKEKIDRAATIKSELDY